MVSSELYTKLCSIRYGTLDYNNKIREDIYPEILHNNLKTLRFLYPEDIEKYHYAICFDVSLYMYKYLKEKNIKYINPFFFDYANHRMLHNSVIFKEDDKDDKFVWIETTWTEFRGIHFASKENDLFDLIKKRLVHGDIHFQTNLNEKYDKMLLQRNIKNYKDFLTINNFI